MIFICFKISGDNFIDLIKYTYFSINKIIIFIATDFIRKGQNEYELVNILQLLIISDRSYKTCVSNYCRYQYWFYTSPQNIKIMQWFIQSQLIQFLRRFIYSIF